MTVHSGIKVAALAGGVGGARLADGLSRVIPPEDLTVIVNTGDDFEHLGLWVSPDLDTVCYTLAGIANSETGWGRAEETWGAMDALSDLGGPHWFRLGDRDLGTHLERTRRIKLGDSLSDITSDFCRAWGVGPAVLPMSDDPAPTLVRTVEGELAFQEYFVRRRCEPAVTGFRFEGDPSPAPGVIAALERADLVVICPSNPWVSIDPILNVTGIRAVLAERPGIAVSPLIGGRAVKGPAAKMYRELGIEPSAAAVAAHYGGLLCGFVIDHADHAETSLIRAEGLDVFSTDALMSDDLDRARLAGEMIEFWMNVRQKSSG
ncbi:MAG TPA: 2-phospho-L-lactate transferase [Anaerolineales bacterium]|nr:2-phospho-L-lactate transferase [Anaerolineales bacterium]